VVTVAVADPPPDAAAHVARDTPTALAESCATTTAVLTPLATSVTTALRRVDRTFAAAFNVTSLPDLTVPFGESVSQLADEVTFQSTPPAVIVRKTREPPPAGAAHDTIDGVSFAGPGIWVMVSARLAVPAVNVTVAVRSAPMFSSTCTMTALPFTP
jgi:hypothetical protein